MKWTLSLLFLLSSQVLAFDLPPDHRATYLVEKYGSTVAKTTLSFFQKDGQLHYTSSSTAEGLAAIFTSDTITENSTLEYQQSDPYPRLLNYSYSRKKKQKYNQTINIKWDDKQATTITSQYRNETTKLIEPGPVWDKLSVQLALINDINTAKPNDLLAYKVIDKNSLKEYKFEYLGDESLVLNNQNYQTKKLKRIHTSGRRMTIMWLATELSYIPVAIEQHKDKEIHWQMKLDNISLKAK